MLYRYSTRLSPEQLVLARLACPRRDFLGGKFGWPSCACSSRHVRLKPDHGKRWKTGIKYHQTLHPESTFTPRSVRSTPVHYWVLLMIFLWWMACTILHDLKALPTCCEGRTKNWRESTEHVWAGGSGTIYHGCWWVRTSGLGIMKGPTSQRCFTSWNNCIFDPTFLCKTSLIKFTIMQSSPLTCDW